MNRSNRFLGYCPNDEKGKAFRADIKAILKGTGFSCVARGYSLKDWCNNKDAKKVLHGYWTTPIPVCMAKELSLYLRPCRGGSFCLSISKDVAETLVVGMVLAVRKIHRMHGNDLNCK